MSVFDVEQRPELPDDEVESTKPTRSRRPLVAVAGGIAVVGALIGVVSSSGGSKSASTTVTAETTSATRSTTSIESTTVTSVLVQAPETPVETIAPIAVVAPPAAAVGASAPKVIPDDTSGLKAFDISPTPSGERKVIANFEQAEVSAGPYKGGFNVDGVVTIGRSVDGKLWVLQQPTAAASNYAVTVDWVDESTGPRERESISIAAAATAAPRAIVVGPGKTVYAVMADSIVAVASGGQVAAIPGDFKGCISGATGVECYSGTTWTTATPYLTAAGPYAGPVTVTTARPEFTEFDIEKPYVQFGDTFAKITGVELVVGSTPAIVARDGAAGRQCATMINRNDVAGPPAHLLLCADANGEVKAMQFRARVFPDGGGFVSYVEAGTIYSFDNGELVKYVMPAA